MHPSCCPHAERSTAASGTEAVGEVRRSSAVSPVVFHVSNVATHAGVTLLVYRLAARLAEARRGRADAETGSSSGSGGGSAGSGSGSNMAAPATLEAFIAALLFALHPVHTEAVAGIVGHAELLCAALSIPALLCYMAAADGRCTSMAAHWGHVAGAVALGWAAAAAKEIGITIVSIYWSSSAVVLRCQRFRCRAAGIISHPFQTQGLL